MVCWLASEQNNTMGKSKEQEEEKSSETVTVKLFPCSQLSNSSSFGQVVVVDVVSRTNTGLSSHSD